MSFYDNGHDYVSNLKEKWEMEEFIQSGKEEKVTGLATIGILEPEPSDFQPIVGDDISGKLGTGTVLGAR